MKKKIDNNNSIDIDGTKFGYIIVDIDEGVKRESFQ